MYSTYYALVLKIPQSSIPSLQVFFLIIQLAFDNFQTIFIIQNTEANTERKPSTHTDPV